MSKRVAQIAIALVLLLVVSLGGLFYHLRYNGLTIEVSQSQIQGEMEAFFPMERQFSGGMTLNLFDPLLILEEGSNRLEYQVGAEVDVAPLNRQFRGWLRVSGIIRFDADQGEFYLDDSRVEDFDVEGIPSIFHGTAREIADRMVAEHLRQTPVYTLEGPIRGEGLLEYLPGIHVRDLEIRDRNVLVTFGI